ncbi:helix-turn-helix domain-containing protein [Marinobacter sp. G11]|uniref:YdaS family helix-turn-helix protein n=1 Tax=Marinobacter TaxID=2742 RepID=UPI0011084BA1|nr:MULTISPECIES: YdaS family helix-turn-helix protein [Marinobacter]MCE0759527.1 helix-turn-helix domain-containing protein [Marinobacter sp. G11]
MAVPIVNQVADQLGGRPELVKLLGCDRSTPCRWSRIPAHHVLKIEGAIREKGGDIDRYFMRPDIYGQRPQSTESKSVA